MIDWRWVTGKHVARLFSRFIGLTAVLLLLFFTAFLAAFFTWRNILFFWKHGNSKCNLTLKTSPICHSNSPCFCYILRGTRAMQHCRSDFYHVYFMEECTVCGPRINALGTFNSLNISGGRWGVGVFTIDYQQKSHTILLYDIKTGLICTIPTLTVIRITFCSQLRGSNWGTLEIRKQVILKCVWLVTKLRQLASIFPAIASMTVYFSCLVSYHWYL